MLVHPSKVWARLYASYWLNNHMAIRAARILFAVLLLVSVGLSVHLGASIQIDTDLADVSPNNQYSRQIQAATDALQHNIQHRIILLVSGAEDAVYDADEALRTKLERTPNVTVHKSPDQQAEALILQLADYRFSLLTDSQQASLKSASPEQIANDALAAIYGLSGQIRVLPFAQDPLGIHSETLLQLAPTTAEEPANDSAFLAIQLSITDGALNMRAQSALKQQLDLAIDEVTRDYSVAVDRSGIFFFAAEAAKRSKQDIGLISAGSSVGVILLILLVFRSLRALLLPIASIALGVGFAFILTHTLYGQVHVLTIVFGASLIGIVIDYSLHYFYHGASHHRLESEALASSTSEKNALLRALALSLLTSMIGYAALGFSSLQALQKVAVFSCAGLFMAWLSVICLGDWALRKKLAVEQRVFPQLISLLSALLHKLSTRWWASIVMLVLTSGVAIALLVQPFDDDPRVFFKAPADLLASEQRVAQVASDFEPGQYIVLSGDNQQQIYQRYASLQQRINQSKTLRPDQFTSLMNWVPSQAHQNDIYQLQEKLYSDNGATAIFFDKLAQSTNKSTLIQEYQSAADRRLLPSTLVELLGTAMPPLWFEGQDHVVSFVLIQKGVNASNLAPLLDGLDGIQYVNTLADTEAALAKQRQSALKLLVLAYALVGCLMVIRFREKSALWLISVPGSATAMLFIMSVVLGFSLNLFHVMALFLVLGFGMDYAIFVHELKQRAAITLQAILLSALTSLLSFGLLGLSSIPVVASFGITLLVGNLFNLLGALVYARTQTPLTQ